MTVQSRPLAVDGIPGLETHTSIADREPADCRWFRFFDIWVQVRSDLPDMLNLVDTMFAGFAIPDDQRPAVDHASAEASSNVLICSVFDSPGERIQIQLEGRDYRIERRDAVGLAYLVLFQATLRRIRSHLLLHAGALEHQGRGVLLVGDSGAGKSTLVWHLVHRGFRLLSDDIGAVRLSDGLLTPFPRSLGFVPKTEDRQGLRGSKGLGGPVGLAPDLCAAMPLIGGGEKLIVRPEALGRDRMGRRCRPTLLVFLPSGPAPQPDGESLHVVLSELSEALRSSLADLPEVHSMETVPNRLFPELRFRSPSAGRMLHRIDQACARFSTAILETSRGQTRTVHRERSPEWTPMAKSEAARRLLRQLHVTQNSALIQKQLGGSGARLLFQLAHLVDGMSCAMLSVGNLEERADLICRALEQSPPMETAP